MAQDNTVPLMLVVAAAVSSIAGLVFLPLLPSVGSLSLYSHMDRAFAYDMVMTCITGVASYMAFIPAVVLATERAAIEHRPHRRQRWRQRQRRIMQRRQDAKWAAGGGVVQEEEERRAALQAQPAASGRLRKREDDPRGPRREVETFERATRLLSSWAADAANTPGEPRA